MAKAKGDRTNELRLRTTTTETMYREQETIK